VTKGSFDSVTRAPAPHLEVSTQVTSPPTILPSSAGSAEEAIALFDRLAPVDIDFMLGAWRGRGFHTGHPLDGLLEACRWHGKRFEDEEQVHPLVFETLGGRTRSVNPVCVLPGVRLVMRLPFLKSNALGRLFQLCLPLLATRRSRARLRLTSCRGSSSATMIYDDVPINDVFRQVDQDTVLGLMDLKGVDRPFFFLLRRE
jgi:hypothetical protein